MLVNSENTLDHVKFISYTGKSQNLCRGVLTLEIDGKEWKFGHDYMTDWRNDGNHRRFWSSGGSCYFSNDYKNSYIEEDEWIINVKDLPEEIKKYAEEIDRVFNDNVTYGCCGGCL